jgi:hypothetical protein
MVMKSDRRTFLKKSAAGLALGLVPTAEKVFLDNAHDNDVRIGMIGLDTSHSTAFTAIINDAEDDAMKGYRVVAAYPYGSRTIESSYSRIPGYIEDIKKLGVEVVGSIATLLKNVDAVMLETNDGNLHLEQALEVFRAGKPLFIDKPVAGSLGDAMAIYEAAEQYNVPVFSSSSLRWARNTNAIRNGDLIGKVLGAFTYSPAHLEPSHPDLYWYGVHGVEMLYSVMGTGCREVTRVHKHDFDIAVGIWDDGRPGTFHGGRSGNIGFGGIAHGEKRSHEIGPYDGYRPIMMEVINFFKTGKPPVSSQETIEIFAFMEAADESKRRGGNAVRLEEVIMKARG